MLIEIRSTRVIISEPRGRLTEAAAFAVICLAAAYVGQLGPHGGSTPSIVFSVLCLAGGAFIALRPLRHTVVDHDQRTITVTNIWPWGRGGSSRFAFADVSGVDINVTQSEGGPSYAPYLKLASGRRKYLAAAGCTQLHAQSVAATIQRAMAGIHPPTA